MINQKQVVSSQINQRMYSSDSIRLSKNPRKNLQFYQTDHLDANASWQRSEFCILGIVVHIS